MASLFNINESNPRSLVISMVIYALYVSRKRGWVVVVEKVSVNEFIGFVD